MSNDNISIVTFGESWQLRSEFDRDLQAIDSDWIEYCRRRERAERAAAKNARSGAARLIHQQLAQAYAQVIQQGAKLAG